MNQYREDEIRAIVNETAERRSYVSAHCHPVSAIKRCVGYGVRVIEHGTELGEKFGVRPESRDMARQVRQQIMHGLESMRRAKVNVGFGTDLLGETYVQQCREFTIRKEVFSPLDVLPQATSTNAEILQHEGKLGCIKAEAYADLLIVDGDPLKDIEPLAASGRRLSVIMRAGELVRNELS